MLNYQVEYHTTLEAQVHVLCIFFFRFRFSFFFKELTLHVSRL